MTAAPTERGPVGLRDVALRDAIQALARAKAQAPHAAGPLGGGADAAVAREVAAFAEDAQRRGVGLDELLVAVAAAVRQSGAALSVGPREAVVRDATRGCVKAYYEARAAAGAATPTESGGTRP